MLRTIKDLIKLLRVGVIRLKASLKADKFTNEIFSKVLIVAPHPDDEVLGCSGLMRSLLKAGKDVYVVILTGGEGSHNGCCLVNSFDLICARRGLAKQANTLIGIKENQLYFLDYQDGNIYYECDETIKLDKLINMIRPDAVFVPHGGEGWRDHLQASIIIQNIIANNSVKIRLYEYCVWFWFYNVWNIEWSNACLLSMTKDDHIIKNKAIDIYIHSKAPCGKPWSGVLPKIFIIANRWNKELYFKIR